MRAAITSQLWRGATCDLIGAGCGYSCIDTGSVFASGLLGLLASTRQRQSTHEQDVQLLSCGASGRLASFFVP